MNALVTSVKRSRFYYSLNPIIPINHVLQTRADAWGSLITVATLLGTVSLVRLALNWAP
jgi:hypothetical protein